jgi:hypothetical protein
MVYPDIPKHSTLWILWNTMKRPAKILLASIAAAALVWTAGALNARNLTRHESALETQCKSQTPKPGEQGFVPDCDWKSLASTFKSTGDPDSDAAFAPVGIQADILNAHKAVAASKTWPTPAALVLLGIGATPWLWYFLLRRIAELRSAIGGKPPI